MLRWTDYARPIAAGLVVAATGLLPWTTLITYNVTHRPDLPWAAGVVGVYLIVWVGVLRLVGWLTPRGTERRASDGLSTGAVVAMLAGLYVLWIAMGLAQGPPDLREYPTTAIRWSLFLMGGLVTGVVEEVAYRGCLQRWLEGIDRERAVTITSVVFVLSHITQGPLALVTLGAGYFAASWLYGTLAQRTGSILPGMAIHIAGDIAYMYFGLLRADLSQLTVGL